MTATGAALALLSIAIIMTNITLIVVARRVYGTRDQARLNPAEETSR